MSLYDTHDAVATAVASANAAAASAAADTAAAAAASAAADAAAAAVASAAAAAANAAAANAEVDCYTVDAFAQEIVLSVTNNARGMLRIFALVGPTNFSVPSLVRLLRAIAYVKNASDGFECVIDIDNALTALMIALKPLMMNDAMDNDLDECVRIMLQLGAGAQYPETPVLNRILREG